MNASIYAAIDVGSNSVRLMVARAEGDQLTVMHTARIVTRLMNGVKGGRLSGETVLLTAQAVAGHVHAARELGAQKIEAFGTSALRDAQNGHEFSELTRSLCGVGVKIIPGVEEAQLAYAGAAPHGKCGVIDIGGGSTELIIGADGQMLRAHSAQMGAVRLMNALEGRIDPAEMMAAAEKQLVGTVRTVCTDVPDKWIGVGGTITTLAAMTKKVDKYTPHAIQDFPLTEDAVGGWLHRLCGMSIEERRCIVGLPPARADIIPYGAAILASVMRLAGADPVHACDHDNLEGYIRSSMLFPPEHP